MIKRGRYALTCGKCCRKQKCKGETEKRHNATSLSLSGGQLKVEPEETASRACQSGRFVRKIFNFFLVSESGDNGLRVYRSGQVCTHHSRRKGPSRAGASVPRDCMLILSRKIWVNFLKAQPYQSKWFLPEEPSCFLMGSTRACNLMPTNNSLYSIALIEFCLQEKKV